MAMLLKFNIVGNWMFIFFVLGFMMVCSMGMGFIPIAIFAAALAFLYWKIDSLLRHRLQAQARTCSPTMTKWSCKQ